MAPLALSQNVDSSTWQAMGLVLTVVGLGLTAMVWRRVGAGRGLQLAGWSLVPLAAGLTGVLRLAWEILDAVLGWATRLVFSPVVWSGLVLAGVALGLYVTGRLLIGRTQPPPPAVAGSEPRAVSRPPKRKRSSTSGAVVEDQDDIEAILRKHGIS